MGPSRRILNTVNKSLVHFVIIALCSGEAEKRLKKKMVCREEAGEAEKEDGDEDGLLSLHTEKRLVMLRRRMEMKWCPLFTCREEAGEAEKMKMVSSLYLQRMRLVRLRRRMEMKMVSSLICRGRGC